jgi:hypothetical protein
MVVSEQFVLRGGDSFGVAQDKVGKYFNYVKGKKKRDNTQENNGRSSSTGRDGESPGTSETGGGCCGGVEFTKLQFIRGQFNTYLSGYAQVRSTVRRQVFGRPIFLMDVKQK